MHYVFIRWEILLLNCVKIINFKMKSSKISGNTASKWTDAKLTEFYFSILWVCTYIFNTYVEVM